MTDHRAVKWKVGANRESSTVVQLPECRKNCFIYGRGCILFGNNPEKPLLGCRLGYFVWCSIINIMLNLQHVPKGTEAWEGHRKEKFLPRGIFSRPRGIFSRPRGIFFAAGNIFSAAGNIFCRGEYFLGRGEYILPRGIFSRPRGILLHSFPRGIFSGPRGIFFAAGNIFSAAGNIATFHFRGEYLFPRGIFDSAGNTLFSRGTFFISFPRGIFHSRGDFLFPARRSFTLRSCAARTHVHALRTRCPNVTNVSEI